MPVAYAVDANLGIVRTTFQGTVRYDEVSALVSKLAHDPAFQPDFSELATFEDDCDIGLNHFDFVNLAKVSPFAPGAKRALVTRSVAVYGTLRMYELARDEAPNVKIFETVNEAVSWLSGD